MADKDALTEGNMKILRLVMQNAVGLDKLDIAFKVVAEKGGYATIASARTRWLECRKKLMAGDAGAVVTPNKKRGAGNEAKGSKSAKKSKSNIKEAAVDDNDEGVDETPTKKIDIDLAVAKVLNAIKAKAKKDEEAEEKVVKDRETDE